MSTPSPPEVRLLLARVRDNHRNLVHATGQIFARISYNTSSFEDGVKAFADTALLIHFELMESKRHTMLSHVQSMLAHLFAKQLPDTSDGKQILFSAAESNSPIAYAFLQLAHTYGRAVRARKAVLTKVVASTLPAISPEDARIAADELFGCILELREYGVKPCMMHDGFMHTPDTTWVFNDGSKTIEDMPQDFHSAARRSLAVVSLATRREVTSLKRVTRAYYGREGTLMVGNTFLPLLQAAVQFDGTLTLDPFYGMHDLCEVFRSIGQEHLYEAFRFVLFLRLFSLIVPVELAQAESLAPWPILPSTRRQRDGYEERITDDFATLWVPRVRLARDPSRLRAAMQRENTFEQEEMKKFRPYARETPGFSLVVCPKAASPHQKQCGHLVMRWASSFLLSCSDLVNPRHHRIDERMSWILKFSDARKLRQ